MDTLTIVKCLRATEGREGGREGGKEKTEGDYIVYVGVK